MAVETEALVLEKKYGEIVDELDKIITFLDKYYSKTSKKRKRINYLKVYRSIYRKCMENPKNKCLVSYQDFYSIAAKEEEISEEVKKENKKLINDRIKKMIKNSVEEAIKNYYDVNPFSRKILDFVKCSKDSNSKLCLDIKFSESSPEMINKKVNKLSTVVVEAKDDIKDTVSDKVGSLSEIVSEAKVDIKNLVQHHKLKEIPLPDRVLKDFNRKYMTLYECLLGLMWGIPVGLAVLIITGFLQQFITNPSTIHKINIIAIGALLFSVLIVVLYLENGFDFKKLNKNKQRVPSKLTKFLLIPFFFIFALIKREKFISPTAENIVLYITNKNSLVVAEINEQCPICKTAGLESKFKLKNMGDLVVAECEENPLHIYIYDYVTKKGYFLRKRR